MYKAILVLCAQALFMQVALSQCLQSCGCSGLKRHYGFSDAWGHDGAAGAGAINHHCGDGINAMTSDGFGYAGDNGLGYATGFRHGYTGAYGLGLGGHRFGCCGARKRCGCGIY